MKYLLISFLMLAFAGCHSGTQPVHKKIPLLSRRSA